MSLSRVFLSLTFVSFLALFGAGTLASCSRNNLKKTGAEDLNSATDTAIFTEIKPDVDLTKMSTTMIFAEVFNMLVESENYVGKVVKIRGAFDQFVPNDKTESVMMVVVSDSTACCQQGLEFKAGKNFLLDKQNLPVIGAEIEISGVFTQTVTKEGYDNFYLDLLDLKVL